MSWNQCINMDNTMASLQWLKRFKECREGQLTSWVSKFHKDKLPCRLASDLSNDFRGSYNWACVVTFTNEEKWVVRFPIDGKAMNPDEKVEIEVATINVIRQQTDIPVPEIKAWGLTDDNELELGPFIMFSYVPGVNLFNILKDPKSDPRSKRMREDISDRDLNTIFQQVANIMLRLSKLDFARIGSLSRESQRETGYAATIHSRPLTLKGNEILRVMGVDVFGPKTTTFSSTSGYFTHVVKQDWRHFYEQPNSVQDEHAAKYTYLYWKVLESLIPRFVLPKYEKGPFKLICDDFSPANMIVNPQDLKVVAVVDWEWTYAGPCQLFWSAPRWLVIEPPFSWEHDEIRVRYEKYLEIFLGILKKEEVNVLGEEMPIEERPSTLMSQSKTEGKMWFHHFIWEGSLRSYGITLQQLRAYVSFKDFFAAVPEEEVSAFVETKMEELAKYNEIEAERRVRYEQWCNEEQWQNLMNELNRRV